MRFWGIALVGAVGLGGVAEAQVTSNFGMRRDPFHGGSRMHAGMDMAGREGTPIYATGDGYVRRARWAGGYGNLVEIEHGFGFQSRFAHLQRAIVQEGQFVRRGQMIGLMGSTGRSTGPHLHYEVRINGRPVQPANHMQIVFTQQPDWGAVRILAASLGSQPAPAASRTASIAMARRAEPSRPRERVTGDLEIEYASSGRGGSQSGRGGSGFAAGHARYSGDE